MLCRTGCSSLAVHTCRCTAQTQSVLQQFLDHTYKACLPHAILQWLPQSPRRSWHTAVRCNFTTLLTASVQQQTAAIPLLCRAGVNEHRPAIRFPGLLLTSSGWCPYAAANQRGSLFRFWGCALPLQATLVPNRLWHTLH